MIPPRKLFHFADANIDRQFQEIIDAFLLKEVDENGKPIETSNRRWIALGIRVVMGEDEAGNPKEYQQVITKELL